MTDPHPASNAQRYRETWEDWLLPGQEPPAEQLLTRDELAAELTRLNFKVTPNDLRYWESEGVIPRTVRRWHDGATRATYPRWMVSIVLMIRVGQENNLSLDQIRDFIFKTFRRNIDTPAGQGPTPVERFVYEVQPGGSHLLPWFTHNMVKAAFENKDASEIAYVDIKIVRKDGRTEMNDFRRYIVPTDAGPLEPISEEAAVQ